MIPHRNVALIGITLVMLASLACSTTATPTPEVTTTREEYLEVFNDVTVSLVNTTRIMGQVSGLLGSNPASRAEFADTTSLILDDLNLQLARLEALEPVPDDLKGANDSLKTAIGKYIEAASLFLPQEGEEVALFDFAAFNELMQTGGKNYHEAGRLAAGAQ